MVSQAKLNQIPIELKRHGIEPTQQHIDAVASILQSDGRASVSSAVKRYVQFQSNPQQSTGQTTPSDGSGDKLQDNLAGIADILGDRIAEGIISKAIDRAVGRIESGDWSVNSKSKSKLETLKEALDCEFEAVEENFLSLPSSGSSDAKLLPSSEAVIQ